MAFNGRVAHTPTTAVNSKTVYKKVLCKVSTINYSSAARTRLAQPFSWGDLHKVPDTRGRTSSPNPQTGLFGQSPLNLCVEDGSHHDNRPYCRFVKRLSWRLDVLHLGTQDLFPLWEDALQVFPTPVPQSTVTAYPPRVSWQCFSTGSHTLIPHRSSSWSLKCPPVAFSSPAGLVFLSPSFSHIYVSVGFESFCASTSREPAQNRMLKSVFVFFIIVAK